MSIFDRIKTVIKSNVNEAISKAEDPKKMLNQLIYDMGEQYNKAKIDVAQAISDEKKLKRQYEEEKGKMDMWAKRAELAVQKGDDRLALEALGRKKEYEGLVVQYEQQWTQQKQATDALKSRLRDLSNKIEEAKRKKNLLIARQKRAEAQKSIQRTMSSMSDTSAFDTFSRMEEKVTTIETQAEAEFELDNDLASDDLDKEFKALEKDDPVLSDELAALKAKFNQNG